MLLNNNEDNQSHEDEDNSDFDAALSIGMYQYQISPKTFGFRVLDSFGFGWLGFWVVLGFVLGFGFQFFP
jgi:hypothetical protein